MGKATILVVEDDPDIRELLSFSLAKEGWSLVMAEDGEKGLLALPSANPCLLYTSPSPRDRQKSRMPSSA